MGSFSSLIDKKNNPKKSPIFIASPHEPKKVEEGVKEGVTAGAKAAVIACVVTAVPTLVACRVNPWAKANINNTGQALIISGATIASFFITVDKTIHKRARKNSFEDY